MAAEFEEKFKELCQQKNVLGALIMTNEGAPIRSSLDTANTTLYANMVYRLITTCKELLHESDSSNDVKFLRFTTKKYEMMISPDAKFVLVAIHNLPDDHKCSPLTECAFRLLYFEWYWLN